MDKKIITYKDSYGTVYKTNPIPVSLIKRKIHSIQSINDNNATIISIQ
jgi:hypothetical protein